METKYQIEIDNFRKNFYNFKDKKIAIYGIGRRTLTLLSGIQDFNIVGLLDRDPINIGRTISDIPVISLTEAEKKADYIIINSDSTNFLTIYKRIVGTKIPIYYSNGKMASSSDLENLNYQNNSYWTSSYEDLIEKIKNYDIISFDLFDTLIMRRVLLPYDLFHLVQKRLSESQNLSFDFISARQKAAASIKNKEPLLREIYDIMAYQKNLSSEQTKKIMQLELDLEQEFCIPRQRMLDIFHEVQKLGKQIYIISDTYFELEQLKPILKNCNITGISDKNIWLSGVKNKTKASGSLWQEFQVAINGKSVLHIGDNQKSDVEIPKKYGINTYYIMSAKDMMQFSSISNFLSRAINFSDSLHLGLLSSRLFSDPFALHSTKGKVHFKKAEDFGYVVFGGIMMRFFGWLYNQVSQKNCEQILFFGRDGYFLERDFNYKQKILGMKLSRRLMYIVNIKTEEDLYKAAFYSYNGKFENYLYSRFNIKANDLSKTYNKEILNTLTIDKKKLINWLEPYRNEIMKEAAKERKYYLNYLEKHNLLPKEKKCAIVDHRFYGTTQYYLQKLTNQKYDGYYFSACFSESNEYLKTCSMHACFNDESDPDAQKGLLNKKGAFIESFLTAPYGMLRYIDENGKCVYESDKMNQKNFNVKENVNNGILQYIRDFLNIGDVIDESGINSIEEFTSYTLLNGTCTTTPDVINGFYYDNDMIGTEEQPMEL